MRIRRRRPFHSTSSCSRSASVRQRHGSDGHARVGGGGLEDRLRGGRACRRPCPPRRCRRCRPAGGGRRSRAGGRSGRARVRVARRAPCRARAPTWPHGSSLSLEAAASAAPARAASPRTSARRPARERSGASPAVGRPADDDRSPRRCSGGGAPRTRPRGDGGVERTRGRAGELELRRSALAARDQRPGPVGRKVDQQDAAEAVGFRSALALGVGGGLKGHGLILPGNRVVIHGSAPRPQADWHFPVSVRWSQHARARRRPPRCGALASRGRLPRRSRATARPASTSGAPRSTASPQPSRRCMRCSPTTSASARPASISTATATATSSAAASLRTLLGDYARRPPELVRLRATARRESRASPCRGRASTSRTPAPSRSTPSARAARSASTSSSTGRSSRASTSRSASSRRPRSRRCARSRTTSSRTRSWPAGRGRRPTSRRAEKASRLPLDRFDVSLHPDEPAALLRTAWSTEEPAQWRLTDLSDAASGYLAAVAIRDDGFGPLAFEPATEESR